MNPLIHLGLWLAIPASFWVSGGDHDKDVTQKEEITKTLHFTESGHRKFLLDNFSGYVKVTGGAGNDVVLIAHKTIRAESDRKAAQAKEEVTLETKEEPDRVMLYVDAPWRDRNGNCNYHGYDYYGYEVEYDFEVQVPSKTDFILRTTNNGDVEVNGLEGEFTVENVNGKITMHDIAGSGKVSTVNGGIKATFRENPDGETSFKTINGNLDVAFPDNLSADLKLKTFNGEVFSDYSVTSLPQTFQTVEGQSRHGRVYRKSDSFSVRVGSGGPKLSFDTLNGNIYIVKNEH